MSDLVKRNQSLNQILDSLPIKEHQICEAINKYNQLRNFKLQLADVLEWKDTILRLLPDTEPKAVSFVVDQLIIGNLEYDKEAGIQNIMRGLKRVAKNESGKYELTDRPSGVYSFPKK